MAAALELALVAATAADVEEEAVPEASATHWALASVSRDSEQVSVQ